MKHKIIVCILLMILCLGTGIGEMIYIHTAGVTEPIILEDIEGDASILAELGIKGVYRRSCDSLSGVAFELTKEDNTKNQKEDKAKNGSESSEANDINKSNIQIKNTDYQLPFLVETNKKIEQQNQKNKRFESQSGEVSFDYIDEDCCYYMNLKNQNGYRIDEGVKLDQFSLNETLVNAHNENDSFMSPTMSLNGEHGAVTIGEATYAATVLDWEFLDYMYDSASITSIYLGQGGIYQMDQKNHQHQQIVSIDFAEGVPIGLYDYDGDLVLLRRNELEVFAELYNVKGQLLDTVFLTSNEVPAEMLSSSGEWFVKVTSALKHSEDKGYLCADMNYYTSDGVNGGFAKTPARVDGMFCKSTFHVVSISNHTFSKPTIFDAEVSFVLDSGFANEESSVIFEKDYMILQYGLKVCSRMDSQKLNLNSNLVPKREFIDVYQLSDAGATKIYSGELKTNSNEELLSDMTEDGPFGSFEPWQKRIYLYQE